MALIPLPLTPWLLPPFSLHLHSAWGAVVSVGLHPAPSHQPSQHTGRFPGAGTQLPRPHAGGPSPAWALLLPSTMRS